MRWNSYQELSDITYLPDDSTLKNNQHKQGEQTIVPVLVQAPQSHAEDLENKERRGSMLSEQGSKRRNGNTELVLPIERYELRDAARGETFGIMIRGKYRTA